MKLWEILRPVRFNDGRRVSAMCPVRVACKASDARAIAELTKRHYQQKAVLCYSVSDDVRFI